MDKCEKDRKNSNLAGEGEEHSVILVNVYGCNDGLSSISIVNTKDLTLKQMFGISAKLVISNLETIRWENIHGNICH